MLTFVSSMKTKLILFISIFSLKIGLCQSNVPDSYKNFSSPSKIKILSWNIYMLPGIAPIRGRATRAKAIGETLKDSDYDVIVFQEAFHHKARRKIEKLLEEKFPYQAGPANRKLISMKTNSGIWIFSKHPIRSTRSIIYKNRLGIDAFSRKGALLVEIEINHQRIQVAGTHLQNAGPYWIKQQQCVEFYHRLLKPELKEDVPQIVCGDFNIKQKHEEEYRLMLQNLNAINGELSGEIKNSYNRAENDLHVDKTSNDADLIDYILVRNTIGMEVTHRKISIFKKQWSPLHADLSDHYAVEAQFNFDNAIVASTSIAEKK